jgi:hypothetical protein
MSNEMTPSLTAQLKTARADWNGRRDRMTASFMAKASRADYAAASQDLRAAEEKVIGLEEALCLR